jgi:hypothetical protein
MASSGQAAANSAKVTLPSSSIAYAPAQSNLLTAAQSAVQFSQIKSAINRKARNLPNPIMTERQESESRPASDDFKFPPPPPPGDRPPFDPFDRPRRQGAYTSARGDPRDYPDLPHHDREFQTERFEPYALLNSSPHDLDSSAMLNLPPDLPPSDQYFPSMPMHPMFAALSDSISFANDGAFLPPDTLFAFEAGLSEPHFLYMSAVPEPASLLLLLIPAITLTLRPRRKRSDAI